MYLWSVEISISKGLGSARNVAVHATDCWYGFHPSAFNSSMELKFLGNKYVSNNQPAKNPLVQLKYMGKPYQVSAARASRALVCLTYRGVAYSK